MGNVHYWDELELRRPDLVPTSSAGRSGPNYIAKFSNEDVEISLRTTSGDIYAWQGTLLDLGFPTPARELDYEIHAGLLLNAAVQDYTVASNRDELESFVKQVAFQVENAVRLFHYNRGFPLNDKLIGSKEFRETWQGFIDFGVVSIPCSTLIG